MGLGSGRVASLTYDGSSNLLGVVVDEMFTMVEAVTNYVIRFRKTDGSNVLKGVNTVAGRTNTLTFPDPIAYGQPMPAVGDLCMFGTNGSETIQAILLKVEQGKNMSAILSFVDYAPQIFSY